MNRFDRALPLLLVHEGGFVNHPADPGGATNRGITQNTYNSWRRSKSLPPRSVREITADEVSRIYRESYWNPIRGDELPSGVAYCVFDAAVNSGPGRAIRWMQQVVGARVDGVVGPETLGRVLNYNRSDFINEYCDLRLRFMRSLRHYNTFKNGWERRVAEVRRQATEWAYTHTSTVTASVVEAPAKADRTETTQLSESRTFKGGVTAATAGIGVGITDAISAIEPLAGFSETLRWVFIALVIAGAVWAIYARWDDLRNGRKD
jgi:lysozyme family protein